MRSVPLRLMLKDLAILGKQRTVFLFPCLLFVSIFGMNPVTTAAWMLFPVIMLIQTLDAMDMKGQGHKLARSLPLSPAQAVGARYLLAPALFIATAIGVFAVRLGLRALGAPVQLPEWGVAALGGAAALAYYALLNPVQIKFGFARSRWFNFAFAFLAVFSSSFFQPAKGGTGGALTAFLGSSELGAARALFSPGIALAALAAAALLYALSFLLSCRLWESKELVPEI